jgi:hypothetical protein
MLPSEQHSHDIGASEAPNILILPGMGGDHRMCDLLLPLPGNSVTADYILWNNGESLHDYSSRFLRTLESQGVLSSSHLKCIIGISLGGAVAAEIASQLPESPRVILIGSFLSTSELAWYARLFIRFIGPILPASIYRAAGRILPFFMSRISRVPNASLRMLQDMYNHMPTHFLPRACAALARWPGARPELRSDRVHGVDDHIIPVRPSTRVDFRVKGAKHLVSISHVNEVRAILSGLLHDL